MKLVHPKCRGCEEPLLVGDKVLYADPRGKPATTIVEGIRPAVGATSAHIATGSVILALYTNEHVLYSQRYKGIPEADVVGHAKKSCLNLMRARKQHAA